MEVITNIHMLQSATLRQKVISFLTSCRAISWGVVTTTAPFR